MTNEERFPKKFKYLKQILNDSRGTVVNSRRVALPARSFWNGNAGAPLELAQKPLTISVHGVKPCVVIKACCSPVSLLTTHERSGLPFCRRNQAIRIGLRVASGHC